MNHNRSTSASLLFSLSLALILLLAFFSMMGFGPAEARLIQLNPSCAADVTIYVDADAAGSDNGNSWTDAYTDLQDGLSDARGNVSCGGNTVEIWVAEGVYTPGSGQGDSFELYDDVAIYGGFVGTETARSERDWQSNVTVLSGDKDGNDVRNGFGVVITTTNQSGTNNRHVVTSAAVTATAVLDGFFITAGAAESAPLREVDLAIPDADGGGLYNDGGSPTLSNLVFQGNYAEDEGGGMASKNGAPTLTNISFFNNQATNGGGLWLDNDSSIFTEGIFSENAADNDGGGLYSSGSTTYLNQVLFADNAAGDSGGAMYNTLSDLVLIDTTIINNRGDNGGGGIFNDQSDPTLTNVSIKGNLGVAGGGIHNSSSHPTLTNVQLSGNLALGGGALFNDDGNPILINVTINGNIATFGGGGIYNTTNSNPTIINSIIWNNSVNGEILTTTATIFNDSGNALISNSILQNSGGSDSWDSALGTDQGNNLDKDPLFIGEISPSLGPTTTADLQLKAASPAINAGNTLSYTSAITQDLAGNLRIVDSVIDMGAYEIGCPASMLLHVDKDATGQDTGESWADAYPSLQSALAHAKNCSLVSEIWVASGVYTPGTSVDESFALIDDLAIYGGFVATETARSQRDWETNKTVLSGDIDGDDTADANGVVISSTNQVGDNSYHVVIGDGVTNTALLDGFTITAGQADTYPNNAWGGGIFLTSSYARLSNLIVVGNSADFGGGLANDSSGPTLTNVHWIGNSASIGGGIYNSQSTPSLINVSLVNNAANSGGGIFNDNGNVLNVTGGYLEGNSSVDSGGGFLNYLSDTTLTNVYFSQNTAAENGGGMINDSGTVTITQSLFDQNIAGFSGGGLYGISSNTTFVIDQTTISNNIAETVRGGGLYIREGAAAHVTNSTISGNNAPANDGLAGDAGNGGGIYVGSPIPSYLTLEHVTITDNNAAGSGGGLDINRDDVGDVITITSSIIAGNTDTGGYPDCHAYGTSSYDLVVDSANLFGGSAGDDCQPGASDLSLTSLGQTINDVLLPLADNFGLEAGNPLSTTAIIQTHALIQDSPAIDASNSAYSRDQRNGFRPNGAKNDIGAYETGLLLLDVTIEGSGTVSLTGAAVDCSTGCSNLMVRDTVITLTAMADPGYTFTGWSDVSCPTRSLEVCQSNTSSSCSGVGDCVVTMTSAHFILATFEPVSYSIFTATSGEGSGTVTKSPDMPTYTYGTVVTLTATADEGSVFAGWTDGCPPRSANCNVGSSTTCSGTGNCVLTMTSSVSIEAIFDLDTGGLNHPPDGGVVDTPQPEFDWEGAFDDPSDIVSYTVIITDADGVTYTFTTTDTTFVPDSELPSGTYEWTVVGKTLDGSTVEAPDVFTFSIPSRVVFLPFAPRNTAPTCNTTVQLVEAVPRRAATAPGEIFYTDSLNIPDVSYGCTVHLSSSSSEISPILVDDILQLWVGSDLVFEHDFSQTGSLVEETITLPQSVVEQLEGQSVTIVLSDFYDFMVSSTNIYLISD